jgi:HK97 family phage major capsid protein
MDDDRELPAVLNEIGTAVNDMKSSTAKELRELKARQVELEKTVGRAQFNGLGGGEYGKDREVKEFVNKYVRRGEDRAPMWVRENTETKLMASNVDPDGGYSVENFIAPDLYRILRETSALRSLARVLSIDAYAFEEIQDRGSAMGAGWVGETDPRPNTSTPTLGKIHIPAREMYCNPLVSQQLLDDSRFDIGNYLASKAGEQFGILEDAAFFTGNSPLQPKGWLTYPTAAQNDTVRVWGTWQHIPTGASGAFPTATATVNPTEVFIRTLTALRPIYRTRAVWMLGFKIITDENMPDIGANSLSIALGDFSRAYTIVDRQGIRLLRDPFTAKPFVNFYMTKRVGGDAVDFNAVKLIKFA